ncbi:MAG: hypothetical protein O3A63_06195 [Proteobacteria bacterium]|nr:hypothetical protein [Pseudomonadota bacterium]
MKKTILLVGLLSASPVFGADSTMLREIMGSSVYEESGIGGLTEEQLKVLEIWILNNAVEKKARKDLTPQSTPSVEEPLPVEVDVAVNEAATVDQVAVDQVEVEMEEPITQKYVRIDTLEEADRQVEPDLIHSRIDGQFKGWRNNKTRFRLENGEIWEQRQSSTYITSLDSPEVIIRKGTFGYSMEVPAIGRSVLVKRIK